MKRLITISVGTLLCVAGISAAGFHAVKQGATKLGASRLTSVMAPRKGMQPSIPGMQRATLPGNVQRILTASKQTAGNPSKMKEGLYGWLTYTSAEDADGLYGLNYLAANGSVSSVISAMNTHLTGLWLRDGKWCSYAPEVNSSGTLSVNNYVEYDAVSGDLTTTAISGGVDKVFILSCYDEDTDTAYGYTYNSAGDGIQFSKASGATPTEIEKVADATSEENFRAVTFDTTRGVVIGLRSDGTLAQVEPSTGVQTVLGAVDVPYFYLTGMAYDKTNDCYIYNAQPREDSTYIYSIDAKTLEAKLLYTYGEGHSYIGLWSVGEPFYVNKSAPSVATELTVDFTDGATSGSFIFKLPTMNMGGSPILGNVNWVLAVDGVETRRGVDAAGAEVTVENLELTAGMHEFTVTCSLGSAEGEGTSVASYIGKDTPMAPANVKLDAQVVTWDAVTEGVNGGYINPDEVTYTVWIDDEMIAQGIKATEVATRIGADTPLQIYVAKVMATYDGKDSEVSSSNELAHGDGLKLPVYLAPSDTEVALFTILNANNDNRSFQWTTTQAYMGLKVQAFACLYNSKEAADDWLWLPAVILEDPSKVYTFSMNAFRAQKYTEQFEVKIGKAPTVEAMTQYIVNPTVIEGPFDMFGYPPVPTESNFMVSEAGKYYIGIHCISEKDQYGLYVNEFRVKESEYSSSAPMAVNMLTAVEGAKGALTAEVTLALPTASILGDIFPIDSTVKAYVSVDGSEDEIELSGMPGQRVSCTVETKQGDNTIRAFASYNGVHGPESEVKLFTGLDIPMTVNDFAITTSVNNMDIILSWNPPTEGENGGYVAPTGVTYYLTQMTSEGWAILGVMGKDISTYTLSLPEGSPQNLYTFGVLAGNDSGRSGVLTGASVAAGLTYDLPMKEDFGNGNVNITPLANYSGGQYKLSWGLGDAAQIDDYLANDGKLAFIGYSNSTGNNMQGRISLPRFSTTGINKPAFVMDLLGECCSSVDVYASAFGVPMTLVKNINIYDLAHEEQLVTVDLPAEFANRGWVQIDLIPTVSVSSYYADAFVLYGYTVKNMEPYDFAASGILGTDVAQYGVQATYKGIIVNEGTDANIFPGGHWILTDGDGSQLAYVEIAAGKEAMQPGDSFEAPISITPTADMGNKLHLELTLNPGDNSDVNDSRSLDLTVVKGDTPVITDLRAKEVGYDNVTLIWSELYGNGTVQSFEDETPFLLSQDEIGGFKNVDKDGKPTFTFEGGSEIPGANQPGAYTVWSSEQLASYLGGATLPAADGDKFLIAFSAAPTSQDESVPQTDDWLISPEVKGGTLFSFAACPVSYSFPETLQICFSTTGNDPDDFQLIKEVVLKGAPGATSLTWEEISVELPQDAKYVAIRYCSTDMLGVMLDKIAYVPVSSKIDLTGYNVYRDGEMLSEKAACPDNTYSDDTVKANESYSYIVVPVLSDGMVGLDSNTLRVRTTGVEGVNVCGKSIHATAGHIVVKGYEGKALVVVSTDGIVVADVVAAGGEERVAVASGVYVVKAAGDVVKLVVK